MQKHDRVAFLCPNIPADARGALRRARGRAACWWRSTRGSPPTRSATSSSTPARSSSSSTRSSSRAGRSRSASAAAARVVRDRRHRRAPAIPTRTSSAGGSPEPVRELARGRGGDDLDQLHLGHDGPAQGRHVHAPRRVAERARRDRRDRHDASTRGYLWTLPMFHCNGWCFTWAVTAVGGTHVCLRKVEPGAHLGADRRRGRHPLQRRAHRADRRGQRPEARTGSTASGDGHGGRRAALADPARQAARSSASGPCTSTASPRPTARTPSARWHAEWDALPAERAGAAWPRARARATPSPTSCASSTTRCTTCPRDGETLGEVVMRGNNVMKGYFEHPEATAEAFRGRLVPLGRPRRVAPRRLHRAARPQEGHHHLGRREHLDHRGRAVRWPGTPRCWSARWSPCPTRSGARCPRPSSRSSPGQTATEEEIIEFCREHLAHFKCPAAVEFGELPKTSTGKIQKFVLRDQEWKGREKRIN